LAIAFILLVPLIAPAQMPQDPAESVALETALSKGPVTRDDRTKLYEGIYNGRQGACDLVTVKVKWFPDRPQAGRADILNYRICDGRVIPMGESSPTEYGIPEGIEEFARSIARQAQQYGRASGDYQGFKVLGSAVRSQDKCAVEVKIMRNGKLYGQNILNGCQ
jgi:hypothetical protein